MANLNNFLDMIQKISAMQGPGVHMHGRGGQGQQGHGHSFEEFMASMGNNPNKFVDVNDDISSISEESTNEEETATETETDSEQSQNVQQRRNKKKTSAKTAGGNGRLVRKMEESVKNPIEPEGFRNHHVIYSYYNEMDTASKRVITVAYRRDIKTGYTHYGACIFRKEYPDESFVKATHKKTAFERLMKRPIIFQKTAETKAEFLQYLRKMIHCYGVSN
jgi:membrane-bound lytic murein transglycosylase